MLPQLYCWLGFLPNWVSCMSEYAESLDYWYTLEVQTAEVSKSFMMLLFPELLFIALTLISCVLLSGLLLRETISMPRQSNSGPSRPPLPPPPATKSAHPPIEPAELCVGCILWLPPQDLHQDPVKCNKEACCEKGGLGSGGYDHPVIVLSTQKDDASKPEDVICVVACVTTYRDTKLSDYLTKRVRRTHLQNSLPIKDPEAVGISSFGFPYPEEIELEKNRRLHKQSYIRLDHTYEVPVSMLRQYSFYNSQASRLRLTQGSYTILMNNLDLVPETWYSTKSITKTARKRSSTSGGRAPVQDIFYPPEQATVSGPSYNPPPSQPSWAPVTAVRPTTSVPVRQNHPPPVIARNYPVYQPVYQPSRVVDQHYGAAPPRWNRPVPAPEPECSADTMFWVVAGLFFVAVFAWLGWRGLS